MDRPSRPRRDDVQFEYVDTLCVPFRLAAANGTTRHRIRPRRARRQDRAKPANERDAGGNGAGDLQGLVRRFRPDPRQDGKRRWSLFPDRLDDEGKPEGWTIEPISTLGRLV